MQSNHSESYGILNFGEIYSPYVEGVGEGFTSPKARAPLQDAPFILLETPFLINLDILLKNGLSRPVTKFNLQIHSLFATGLEFFILIFLSVSIKL